MIKFFNDFIDLTDSLNITEVHLTGGEPSLHPDIDLIIKKLKEYNFVVKVTSIGGKKEIFDKIISSELATTVFIFTGTPFLLTYSISSF